MTKTALLFSLSFFLYRASAQTPVAANTPSNTPAAANSPAGAYQGPLDYVCPMDPDVRSDKPGVCSRCGMTLRLGISDQSEYPLELTTSPNVFHPGEKVRLTFTIKDPKNGSTVKQFQIVHEKLFHMFIVSSDLKYFLHDHPVAQSDGTFVFDQVFPKPGMYRIVADIYPTSGSPQLIARTVFVTGDSQQNVSLSENKLQPDMGIQHGENTDVEVTMNPPEPVSGMKTLLFFKFKQADGMQKYLGAWAHMLIASDDTIDLIHEHPFIADGGNQMQFNLIFPRSRTYRIWVQFQRKGIVNTVAVNVPVVNLDQAVAKGEAVNY